MLHESLITGLDQCGHGEMIRKRSSLGMDHAVDTDSAFGGERLLQRWITIGAGPRQFQVFDGHGQIAERNRRHTAYREIEFRGLLCLGPEHVFGFHDFALRFHKKYTGTPVNSRPIPARLLPGYLKTVLITTTQLHATKNKAA